MYSYTSSGGVMPHYSI